MASIFNFSNATEENEKKFADINSENFNEQNNPKKTLLISAIQIVRDIQKYNDLNFKLSNYIDTINKDIKR